LELVENNRYKFGAIYANELTRLMEIVGVGLTILNRALLLKKMNVRPIIPPIVARDENE